MSARAALPAIGRVALPIAMFALALTVIVLVLGDQADIVKKTLVGENPGGGIQKVGDLVNALEVPAKVSLLTVVPLGVLAGGGLMAIGHRKGVQTMATSVGAGAVVLLANGVAA